MKRNVDEIDAVGPVSRRGQQAVRLGRRAARGEQQHEESGRPSPSTDDPQEEQLAEHPRRFPPLGVARCQIRAVSGGSSITGFSMYPIPSIWMRTTSPALRN